MNPTRFCSGNILKLVVIQCLVSIAEHGDEAIAPSLPAGSRTKSASGASLVQKRSHVQKQTHGVVDEDEDDEGHVIGNAMNAQLAPEEVSAAKRIDPAKASMKPGAHNETRSSKDTTALLNVAKRGDDGLTVSMVGNLSNPNASGTHDHTNSSRRKWPSWFLAVRAQCFNTLYRIGAEVMSSLDWLSVLPGKDEEDPKEGSKQGSILLVCFGIFLGAVILGIFLCVHRMAGKIEETEDSSTCWFRQLDDSSPFSSPNRHPWFFQFLGFGWRSRFSAKPMPPYSVTRAHFVPGA